MPHEFYRMTWKDYSRRAQGYWIRHARYMEGVRAIAHVVARANGSKVRDPRKFMPLITDEPIEIIKLPAEEVAAIFARYKRADANNGGRT